MSGATGVNLSGAEYASLQSATLSIAQLQASLVTNGVASSANTLTTPVSPSVLYDAMADAFTASGQTAAAAAAAKLSTQTSSLTGKVALNALVTSDQRPQVEAQTNLNPLDLVTAFAEAFNVSTVNAVQTTTIGGSTLGLTGIGNITLTFFVTDAPIYVCGGAGSTFSSAGMRVKIDAVLTGDPINLSVAGLTSATIQLTNLSAVVTIAPSAGTIQSVTAISNAVGLQVTPGVSQILLGSVSNAAFLDRTTSIDPLTELDWGNLATVRVSALGLGLANATLDLKGSVTTGTGSATPLTYSGAPPQTRTASFGANTLSSAIGNLVANVNLRLNAFPASFLLGGAVQTLLNTTINTLLHTANGVLTAPLSGLLSSTLDPVLSATGIRYGAVDVVVERIYTIAVNASCDDGVRCTQNDICSGSGTCAGTALVCSDSLACTADSCNESTGACVSTPNLGCLIGGACVAEGANNPSNTCQACVGATSRTAYSNKAIGSSCNDGQFCTDNDLCLVGGICLGATPHNCSDGLDCTADLCNETNDRCDVTLTLGCVINGSCRLPLSDDPSNACRSCNPSTSTTAWTNKGSGTLCNDGQFCTLVDTCNGAGTCTGTALSCADALDCTADSCDEANDRCVSTLNASSCVIFGTCYAAGTVDPTNPCHICDPTNSTATWTNKAVNTPCEDGAFCTQGDKCSALGLCLGQVRTCSDGLDCTVDICDEQNDQCNNSVNLGCLVEGVCRTTGSNDPSNSCHTCNPLLNAIGWTNKVATSVCDDGLYCTALDLCNASGTCVGTPRVCADAFACTADSCDEANDTCVYANSNSCIIAGACVSAGTLNPLNPCQICDPTQSKLLWTTRPQGVACDDGLFCTQSDQCSALGLCAGSVRSCSDGFDCTLDVCDEINDVCNSTVTLGCVIGNSCRSIGADEPGNPCRSCNPLVSTTSWTNKSAGIGCDDGQFCTESDQCNGAGSCRGAARNCTDNLSCTSDICNEAGHTCVSTLTSGCLINGACIAADSSEPSNGCHVCTPGTSTSNWTNKAGNTSCDDGQYCTQNDKCNMTGACSGTTRDCSDGIGCTNDTCNELLDTCISLPALGCLINLACVPAGTTEPGNPCRTCDPLASLLDWTNKPVGTSCDDGLFCSDGDQCTAMGICSGSAHNCSDGQNCTADSCDEAADTCRSTAVAGCTIGGTCYASGMADPTNQCRSCDPNVSTTAWTNKPTTSSCNDGNFCTDPDFCNGAGVCAGATKSCSDSKGCTNDSCDETNDRCVSTLIAGGCLIGGACLGANVRDPENPCHVCDPNQNPGSWTNRTAGNSCDDGAYCVLNKQCDANGVCNGTARNCTDNQGCTSDGCDESSDACTHSVTSGCLIAGSCESEGARSPSNTCLHCNPTASKTAWTNRAAGSSCNDGLFCSVDETCDSNAHCQGQPLDCGDGLDCTGDVCDEANDRCVSALASGCLIEGSCYTAGVSQQGQPCFGCNPSGSTWQWTQRAPGDMCNDGKFCTADEKCNQDAECLGAARSCSDTLDCTVDACNEDVDMCEHANMAGCAIGGVCFTADSLDPEDECLVCDPARASAAWSPVQSQTCIDQEPNSDPDMDGRVNRLECPLGVKLCSDTDHDGLADYLDADDDNDGVWSRFELVMGGLQDHDHDGLPDHLDPDDDDDSILTTDEGADANGDGNPSDARDSDSDGVPDYLDDDDDDDDVSTRKEFDDARVYGSDIDHELLPNWRDRDSDGDNLSDTLENDGDPDKNPKNGVPDYLEALLPPPDAGPADAGPAPAPDSGVPDAGYDAGPVEPPDAGVDAAVSDSGMGVVAASAGTGTKPLGGRISGGSRCAVSVVGTTTHPGLLLLLPITYGLRRIRRRQRRPR